MVAWWQILKYLRDIDEQAAVGGEHYRCEGGINQAPFCKHKHTMFHGAQGPS
jgi:hypothetical protein